MNLTKVPEVLREDVMYTLGYSIGIIKATAPKDYSCRAMHYKYAIDEEISKFDNSKEFQDACQYLRNACIAYCEDQEASELVQNIFN